MQSVVGKGSSPKWQLCEWDAKPCLLTHSSVKCAFFIRGIRCCNFLLSSLFVYFYHVVVQSFVVSSLRCLVLCWFWPQLVSICRDLLHVLFVVALRAVFVVICGYIWAILLRMKAANRHLQTRQLHLLLRYRQLYCRWLMFWCMSSWQLGDSCRWVNAMHLLMMMPQMAEKHIRCLLVTNEEVGARTGQQSIENTLIIITWYF